MNFHAESPKLNVEVSSAMADMADQSLNIYHQARLRIWTQLDPSSSWIKLEGFSGRADNSVSWQSQSDSSEDAIIILTYLINSSAKAGTWRLTEERFGSTVCTPGSATKSARFKRDQAGSELVVVSSMVLKECIVEDKVHPAYGLWLVYQEQKDRPWACSWGALKFWSCFQAKLNLRDWILPQSLPRDWTRFLETSIKTLGICTGLPDILLTCSRSW